ncbi:MAG: transketolase family protein [Spirochaetaceae bacterium]|nr:MAG: transketolase family protein [Spirochaetaceae bacterium]
MTTTALKKAAIPTRRAYSDRMAEYGAIDSDFAVMDADIGYSTYSYLFGDKYPERYFNMGIAEVNMFACAAGFAANGRTVVAGSYGVFITMRAVEVIRSFICYPNLNVKILSSHGGLTAAIDGVTHQATEDIATMSTIPNMKVLVPADPVAAGKLFDVSFTSPGPVFTRLMRDPYYEIYDNSASFVLGGSNTLREGSDITLVSYGDMVFQAVEAAEELARSGISAEVIDAYSIKPYDAETILKSMRKTGALLVAENHQQKNGLGYELGILSLREFPVPFDTLGLRDTFAESGDYYKLLEKYGLSSNWIYKAATALVARKEHRNA